MKKKMYGYVGEKKYYPLQIPGDYYPNMDHIELIEAQLTKEGMLAYDSIEETSIATFPGDDTVSQKGSILMP